MRKYLAQRLLIAVPTLFGVTLLIFIAMRVLPGDPLSAISGEGGGTYVLSKEQLQAARVSLGLDRPYVVQYLDWLRDILRGDLGKSFWRGEPMKRRASTSSSRVPSTTPARATLPASSVPISPVRSSPSSAAHRLR